MLCIFHEKKNHNKKQHICFLFYEKKKKYKPDPPLLDGILSIFKSNNVFFYYPYNFLKNGKGNTTNSAKIVIETSGLLFLYCFFSSNHRPP
jgi:hypothetical protein